MNLISIAVLDGPSRRSIEPGPAADRKDEGAFEMALGLAISAQPGATPDSGLPRDESAQSVQGNGPGAATPGATTANAGSAAASDAGVGTTSASITALTASLLPADGGAIEPAEGSAPAAGTPAPGTVESGPGVTTGIGRPKTSVVTIESHVLDTLTTRLATVLPQVLSGGTRRGADPMSANDIDSDTTNAARTVTGSAGGTSEPAPFGPAKDNGDASGSSAAPAKEAERGSKTRRAESPTSAASSTYSESGAPRQDPAASVAALAGRGVEPSVEAATGNASPRGGSAAPDLGATTGLDALQKQGTMDRVTIPFEGEGGLEGRLRIALRGTALHATIVAPDRDTATRIEGAIGELHRALLGRGFGDVRLAIQAPPATAEGSRAETKEHREESSERRHSARDEERSRASDQEPHRRPSGRQQER